MAAELCWSGAWKAALLVSQEWQQVTGPAAAGRQGEEQGEEPQQVGAAKQGGVLAGHASSLRSSLQSSSHDSLVSAAAAAAAQGCVAEKDDWAHSAATIQ